MVAITWCMGEFDLRRLIFAHSLVLHPSVMIEILYLVHAFVQLMMESFIVLNY